MEKVEPIRDRKQVEAIKKILKSTNLRDYCLFTLGVNGGGMRISDLLRLRLEHIMDEKGKLKSRVIIREKKTGKLKSFPLNDTASKVLKEYLRERDWTSLQEPLFPSRKKKNGQLAPIQRDQAYKVIKEAAQSIGIEENIGTHTMRKTWGYHAYREGYSLQTIQKVFNHSSERITLEYIGITQDELDDVHITLNL